MKRIRYKIGDVFLIPFEDGRIGAGRVLKKDERTILVELYKMNPVNRMEDFDMKNIAKLEILVMLWCYDGGLTRGEWPIVGQLPILQEIEMPEFYEKDVDGMYYLFPGGDTFEGHWDKKRKVTEEELGDSSPSGIGSTGYVELFYKKRLEKKGLF